MKQHIIRAALMLAVVALASCSLLEKPKRPRNFPTADLLLDESSLPRGLILDYGPERAPSANGTSDSAAKQWLFTTQLADGNIQHTVYNYGDDDTAKSRFRASLGDPVPEWRYESSLADQSVMRCADWELFEQKGNFITRCVWRARYEEYLVEFSSDLVPGRMTLAEFERAVKAIDAIMATHLSKSQVATGPKP